MSGGLIETSFNGTCVPTPYPCTSGQKFIAPCSCTDFFLCVNKISGIIKQSCPEGTGYDYITKGCRTLQDIVLDGFCDQETPWDRCGEDALNYDSVDDDDLVFRCTGVPGTQSPQGQKGGDGGGGADGGLIAGVIVAVLIVLVIVVLIVVYVRKRGNPVTHLKETGLWRSVTRKNGRDFSDSNSRNAGSRALPHLPGEEETYAEIEDTAVYKESGGKALEHSMSYTNDAYEKDEEEGKGVTYDNPALQANAPPPPAPRFETPPEYSALEEKERAPRSYSSLSEHSQETSNDVKVKQPIMGDDGYLVAEAIGESVRSNDSSDPQYFVLEKEEGC